MSSVGAAPNRPSIEVVDKPYYLLLGTPCDTEAALNPSYRGICRPGPPYRQDLPRDHPINLPWFEAGRPLPQDDLADRGYGLALQRYYWRLGFELDLIAVTDPIAPHAYAAEDTRLGLEPMLGPGDSLISFGLNWEALEAYRRRPPSDVAAVLRVVGAYFRPLLNCSRLFECEGDARLLSATASFLASVNVGFEPMAGCQPEIVEIYLVSHAEIGRDPRVRAYI